jgi:hypothetical protein
MPVIIRCAICPPHRPPLAKGSLGLIDARAYVRALFGISSSQRGARTHEHLDETFAFAVAKSRIAQTL